MVLSDRTIKEELAKGRLVIDPLDPNHIQPASVDVRLDRKILIFKTWQYPGLLDPKVSADGFHEEIDILDKRYGGRFILNPSNFILASTLEYIGLPDDIMARLEGKSSLGRVGLLIHATAGYVDPGWQGHLTIELANVAPMPIVLTYGMKISQISFHRLTTPAERPYGSAGLGSKYKGQYGPESTRYYLESKSPSLFSAEWLPLTQKQLPSITAQALKQWLKESKFRGNIKDFAQALGIPLGTVKDWFYRGAEPSPPNREKIFQMTQLPHFRPSVAGEGKSQPPLPISSES